MAAVIAAFDTGTLTTNVETSLVVGVTIGLAFLAFKMVKRVMNKM